MMHKSIIAAGVALSIANATASPLEPQSLPDVEVAMSGAQIVLKTDTQAGGHNVFLRHPDGRLAEHVFHGDEAMALPAQWPSAGWPDGTYAYEIRPVRSARVRTSLPSVEADPRPAEIWSGSFAVHDGRLVEATTEETGELAVNASPGTSTGHAVAPLARDFSPVLPAQTFNVDVQVQGSICVGFDCTNSESYAFDTIRLKENNTRIAFRDTSTAGGFPANSWMLVANDSASGGRDYFAIQDLETSHLPFYVMAGAPSNALNVATNGFVGLGTSAPTQALTILKANTPALRLEQSAGEFAAQAWDVAANESGLFVRDASGGDLVPFRIAAGTPSDTLSINARGIAVGAGQPRARLQVTDTNATADGQQLRLESDTRSRIAFADLRGADNWYVDVENGLNNQAAIAFKRPSQARMRGQFPPPTLMRLDGAGNLNLSGTLTQNSDRNTKRLGEAVDPGRILALVRSLEISRWSFLADAADITHIGPMAQDFHARFGLGDSDTRIAPLDTSGVALAAIQGLAGELEDRDRRIAELERDLEQLSRIVERLINPEG